MSAEPPAPVSRRDARRFRSPELVDLATAWSQERARATAPGARHDSGCSGRHGWMLDIGLDTVLEPVLGQHGFETPGFYRFSTLDAATARLLLGRLAPAYLVTERQNDSPAVGAFLDAVAAYPDRLRAHGYVVGPERCDERITVEGVLVRMDQEVDVDPGCRPGCRCPDVVRYVEDELGLALPVPPHEVRRWRGFDLAGGPERGQPWYRLWWD